jgi:3',5'-cyclic AMP phosphodiesterase CpdA
MVAAFRNSDGSPRAKADRRRIRTAAISGAACPDPTSKRPSLRYQVCPAKQDYLLSVISDQLAGRFDRVVITGDLFDSPWKRKWQAFETFRTSLRLITRTDPIVIPGNHDNRIAGNSIWRFGTSSRYIAELEARKLHPDPELKCLFFCFNSSKAGNFARGEVTEDDLFRLATEYHVLSGQNKPVKDWLRIGLVHHHPFKFNAEAEGATAKFLKEMRIPEGSLLDMDSSERFVGWCADRGVQLILHGHRHVQRKMSQVVPVQQNGGIKAVRVTALGCRTSLEAEGVPATYNLVTWDPNSQRWSTTFYRDRSAGGFKEVRAISSTLDPLP